jgi:DNA replication protein DnaC
LHALTADEETPPVEPACTFCGNPAIVEEHPAPYPGASPQLIKRDYCLPCQLEHRLEPGHRCKCGATGRYVDYLDGTPVYACPSHYDDEQARIDKHRADRRYQKYMNMRYQAGDRFEDYDLASYPRDDLGRKVLKPAQEWVTEFWDWEPQRNLILYGDVGTAKSSLAFACARSVIEDLNLGWAVDVEWVAVRALLAQVKASFNGGEPVERDFGDPCDILILDDLGAERCTEWTRDYLATIIEDRYDHGQPTIVTTNYQPSKLAARLGFDDVMIGERLVSRLVENAVVIPFKGADRRIAKKAA